jgi:hypothetical protein
MRSTTRRERKPKSEVLPKKASYDDSLDEQNDSPESASYYDGLDEQQEEFDRRQSRLRHTHTSDEQDQEQKKQMESQNSRKPVFIMRPKGMDLETFKKVCIEHFRKAGMLSGAVRPSPEPEPKRELEQWEMDLRDLEEWDRGLDKILESHILKKESTTPKK